MAAETIKRRKHLILFICLITNGLLAQQMPVRITLHISSAEDGLKIYLLDMEAVEQVLDSANLSKGMVAFNRLHDGSFMAAVSYEFNPKQHRNPGVFTFFADSTPLNITADMNSFADTRVPCTGINDIMCLSYRMNDQMKALYTHVSPVANTQAEADRFNALNAAVYNGYTRNCINYMINKPDAYGSLFSLGGMAFQMNRDTVMAIYNSMNDESRKNKHAQKVAAYLAGGKTMRVGDYFADVSGFDRNGRLQSLSEHKGKVILLDFWNLHCVPCVLQKPYLSSLHADKSDSGFLLFSFFLDKNHKNFLDGTANDAWLQVTDDQGFFSKAAIAYGVSGIPLLVLIGRDGKIIAFIQGHEFGEGAYSKLNAMISEALKQ